MAEIEAELVPVDGAADPVKALDGVEPARYIVTKDAVNGIIAGRAANMLSIGFVGGGHADAHHTERLLNAGAQRCVARHNEIMAWIRDSRLRG